MNWFVRRAGVARTATFACALGLALAALVGGSPVVAVGGLIISLLAALAGARWEARRVFVPAIVIIGLFAGYLGGTVRMEALEACRLRALVGQRVGAELVITGPVRESSGWLSATAVVRSLHASVSGAGEAVLLEVPPPEDAENVHSLEQGMIVASTVRVRAPDGPSDSGFDQAKQLRHQGISVVFRAENVGGVEILGRRGGVSGWFDKLRAAAKDHLSRGPDPRVNEVLQGVVMGDTAGIDKDWLVAFRRSGTAHMLSVSGLHVAALAAIILGLMRLLHAPRGAGFLGAAAAAVLLVPFVGPSPPVVRSAIMIVVVLAGRWAGRSRDQWQVLFLAAAMVLGLNPFAFFDVGFQLSFSAFLGMLLLLRPLQRLFRRLPEAVASNVAVSLAASAGTAPVALLVFGKTSLVSPIANLLVVPTLPLVTGLGMASVILGYLGAGLSMVLDTLASLPMTWTILVSRVMATAPVLDATGLARLLLALLVAAGGLPAALALLGRAPRVPFGLPLPFFRRTVAWLRAHRPRDSRLAALSAGAVVIIGLLVGMAAYPVVAGGADTLAIAAHRTAWPEDVEVRVLDVGQGNAVLVRTPAHRALLFDGGPAGCDLAGQLRALGVDRLDLVVISHPHADHFAGLLEAAGRLEVRALVDLVEVVAQRPQATRESSGLPAGRAEGASAGSASAGAAWAGGESGSATEAADYLELRRELAAEGCRHIAAGNAGTLTLDGLSLRLFGPNRPVVLSDGPDPWAESGGQPSGDELNGSSVVSVLSVGSIDVLLPGDAEADTLAHYPLPPSEVLVVPHHGSRGAVSRDLLKRWGTRIALISVGKGNSFGHPNPGTVSALEQSVGAVLRTDTSGWVSCRVRGDSIAIATERKPAR